MKTTSFSSFVLSILIAGPAFATALSKPVQVGPKAIGMGGAFVGVADDPTAIYHNPAGITQLDGHQLEVGMDALITQEDYTPPGPGAVKESAKQEFLPVPQFAYVSSGFNPVWWGLGVFFPHGNGGKFETPSAVITNPTEGRIYSLEIDPTVAFQLFKGFSIGGTIRVIRVSSSLKNQLFQVGGLTDMLQDLDVDGWGVGGSFGFLYKPCDFFSFGTNYRSKASVRVGGHATFQALGPMGAAYRQTLPMLITTGFAVKPWGDKLTLAASYDFEKNSEIQTLNVTLSALGTVPLAYNYTDSHTIHLGAEYKPIPVFALRAGWAKDLNSSIPDTSINRIIGDVAANEVSFGMAYTYKRVTLEGTWNARFGSRTVPVGTLIPAPGTIDAFVNMVSLAAQIRL